MSPIRRLGVSGFINCSKPGLARMRHRPKIFCLDLKPNRIGFGHQPMAPMATIRWLCCWRPWAARIKTTGRFAVASGINPWRYVNPGINNPNSYDLWVQLVISGRTNLVCNWSKQTQLDSPLP